MENRIWLKGDTHLHTCNSDGKLTPGQLVEACQQAGLDYAIITDHNYNTVKASYTDKNLLVMQGQEITDDLGHINVWGGRGHHLRQSPVLLYVRVPHGSGALPL